MPETTLTAEVRNTFGKNASRQLRRSGKIPAVLYGNNEPSVPLTLIPKNLAGILNSPTGQNRVFSLEIEKQGTASVLIKDWQTDPIKGNLLHADFLRVAMDKPLQVSVPIITRGEAKGVKVQGGILEFVLREVEVECLPADIPDQIIIDITDLEIGANLRVSDLPADPKVEILSDSDLVIAHVAAPKEEKAPEEEAEVVAAEPTEPEVIKKGKVVSEEVEGEEGESEEKK